MLTNRKKQSKSCQLIKENKLKQFKTKEIEINLKKN